MYNMLYQMEDNNLCQFVAGLDELDLDWTVETEDCPVGWTIVKVCALTRTDRNNCEALADRFD